MTFFKPWHHTALLVGAAFFFWLAAAGFGQSSERTAISSLELEKIFTDTLLANTPWPSEDLQLTNFSTRPETVEVPAGVLNYRIIDQSQSSSLGRRSMTVAVLVNGSEQERVRMYGDLQLYGEVACLTRPIPRNEILADADITLVRQNISMLGSDIIRSPEEAVGKQLKTSLRGGSLLFSHLLENPSLVMRGDQVTIVASSAAIRITVPGVVKENGAMGDVIRVKNMMSRKEIYATVTAPGEVEVRF